MGLTTISPHAQAQGGTIPVQELPLETAGVEIWVPLSPGRNRGPEVRSLFREAEFSERMEDGRISECSTSPPQERLLHLATSRWSRGPHPQECRERPATACGEGLIRRYRH